MRENTLKQYDRWKMGGQRVDQERKNLEAEWKVTICPSAGATTVIPQREECLLMKYLEKIAQR